MEKSLIKILALIFVAAALSNCKKSNIDEPSQEDPYQQKIFLNEKAKALVESDNIFGIKLFKTLNENANADENIIISPLSVSIALGMTYNGANGETKEAMENTLELQGISVEEINESYKILIDELTSVDPKVTMNIPNSIWYRNTFDVLQDFININQNYFYAKVSPLNFDDPASVGIINNWVAENTNQKISEIIDNIDQATVMFLINAVYFNGTWVYEFDEQNTHPETFYLANGTTKQVDMMKQETNLNYFNNDMFKAVDLNYGSGNFSMVILLPKESYTPDDIIEQLNTENWTNWMNGFSEKNIQLSLPKFKLEYEKRLNDALVSLGMGIAFNPYIADFSKINANHQLYIDFVLHKTFIDVNEVGTEAAAVTIVAINLESVDEGDTYYFTVDRPFLFAIKERDTKAIVFLGKVMEPEYED
ncbi:MAG: serpin family protein [Bacteroidales bacterium]|nr:serpin family protein [Bacteroidales bacterium]